MYGLMVKLVDTGDLKSPAEKRTCSTQVRPTIQRGTPPDQPLVRVVERLV